MKILFLIYHGLSAYSGISKKIQYQVKGLKAMGHDVYLCTYTFDNAGNKIRIINDNVIENLGKGYIASLKRRIEFRSIIEFVKHNHIDLVYARSFHNANPFTIHLFKTFKSLGIKSVIEIPTYPYDKEYCQSSLRLKAEILFDKLFRKELARTTDAIVTFSNDEYIFGQKTIRISNGIDFESIRLKSKSNHDINEFHLIGVAEVHYWHGYDRIIEGIGEYYKQEQAIKVYFHIIGGVGNMEMEGTRFAPGFNPLIKKYHIENYIIFHGQKFGEDLDNLFDLCDFAVGSLGRHRSGVAAIKTLKNREYAARGIPFIYSETDEDFENLPFVMKASKNNEAINIQGIFDFFQKISLSSQEIRDSIKNLSWEKQMEKVILSIEFKKA